MLGGQYWVPTHNLYGWIERGQQRGATVWQVSHQKRVRRAVRRNKVIQPEVATSFTQLSVFHDAIYFRTLSVPTYFCK